MTAALLVLVTYEMVGPCDHLGIFHTSAAAREASAAPSAVLLFIVSLLYRNVLLLFRGWNGRIHTKQALSLVLNWQIFKHYGKQWAGSKRALVRVK